jgi:hypothetical protein
MLARQVVIHRIEIQGLKFFVRTLPAFDSRFLTDPRNPLILTGDRIAGTAAGSLPADRINILSAAKEVPEQFCLLVGSQLRCCGSFRGGMKLVLPRKKGSLFPLKLG